ncbi:HNH endonuclease [Agrobacterium tumefaciens]|uniref:HNH endonuclease n=1 Tax=Agrobacterium tumefaciens TaxID=358 RepID=A0A2L2LC05_AGRTU|nr:HNH endonuclease signature motif containing protein [Agrobacterium tumefaciens]AVH41873.1 HNH endonuclease [Agrobacterium tumefaciens]
MARTVEEWRGRTDDTMPPPRVKDRIRERQGNKCALTGVTLGSDEKVQYDHIVPLWLGGANTESNLQAVTAEAHKKKTKAEATVRAKCNRVRKKHRGITKPKSSLSHPNLKRLMDGTVVDRRTGEIVGGRQP